MRCKKDLAKITMPSFYKECIEAFHNVKQKCREPATKEDVLRQYMWGNSWIKLKGECIQDKEWCKKGIQYVGDLFTVDGQVREEHIFGTLGDRAAHFLNMHRYVGAIPRSWKEILKSGENGSIGDDSVWVLDMENGSVDISKCKQRDIYMILMNGVTKSSAEDFWESKFQILDWETVYKMQNCAILQKKVRDFRWKIINKGLTTEAKLKHFTDSDGVCQLCNLEAEDEQHNDRLCNTRQFLAAYF
jgi:hypothetical protein